MTDDVATGSYTSIRTNPKPELRQQSPPPPHIGEHAYIMRNAKQGTWAVAASFLTVTSSGRTVGTGLSTRQYSLWVQYEYVVLGTYGVHVNISCHSSFPSFS